MHLANSQITGKFLLISICCADQFFIAFLDITLIFFNILYRLQFSTLHINKVLRMNDKYSSFQFCNQLRIDALRLQTDSMVLTRM